MIARLVFAAAVLASSVSFAGVAAYIGKSGEKLFVESAGAKKAYVKFEGIESPWSGKVIEVEKGYKDRYSFKYELELSSGVQKREWTLLVPNGQTLSKGSLVDLMEIHVQGQKDPVKVMYDGDLTASSQKIDLASEYKKSKFVPDVD